MVSILSMLSILSILSILIPHRPSCSTVTHSLRTPYSVLGFVTINTSYSVHQSHPPPVLPPVPQSPSPSVPQSLSPSVPQSPSQSPSPRHRTKDQSGRRLSVDCPSSRCRLVCSKYEIRRYRRERERGKSSARLELEPEAAP